MHNAARMLRNRRNAQDPVDLVNEGGPVETKPPVTVQPAQNPLASQAPVPQPSEVNEQNKVDTKESTPEIAKDTSPKVSANASETVPTVVAPVTHENETKANVTLNDKSIAKEVDFNSPGVLKRGFIVFGGFALMAVAYFIFYRRKSKKNDSNNTSTIDANQFRYGVLQSEDQRDNLELSRVPLTMESDDDEDEDLEIFDLEQKKKSLSYVNLQMNDEDIVLNASDNKGNERDNLLLDIDDANSETLINWSSNGSKSIL
ncbi:hypothetical protein O3G_MSEX005301 [Manduca sexta]|uniref:Uncharacterized protein n=2 Tax=Manduca sexta TaxID=7130 RepID=A0A921YY66_MANSE|nr:hypothetical protein O3G_MSEX005301 [Manduca sexta]